MDMRKYAGSRFLKVEDVEAAQIKTIAKIEDGKFDKPVATFDDGSKLSLNKTNVRELVPAFGEDSDGWVGQRVQVYAGEIEYMGDLKPSELVKPPPMSAEKTQTDPMDDEIPF